jgi:hypothetical protein
MVSVLMATLRVICGYPGRGRNRKEGSIYQQKSTRPRTMLAVRRASDKVAAPLKAACFDASGLPMGGPRCRAIAVEDLD